VGRIVRVIQNSDRDAAPAVSNASPATAAPAIPGHAADDLVEAIVGELRGSLRELRCGTMERIIRLGVSMTQIHVLWLLEHHGDMPMSRLAELLDVSVSNSTGLIDRMEERSLVERMRVPGDRRVVLVRIGPQGIRVLGELEAMHHERLRRALARLEPTRLSGVLEAFSDFRTAIEADLCPECHSHTHPVSHHVAASGEDVAFAPPPAPTAAASF
jgi:DNA-binding MarR family transcriptional regulator